MPKSDVLVLGGSGAGKTHFAGQLLGRMRYDRQGMLRLRQGGVDDLSILEEVLSCLEEGRAAGHTPAATWAGLNCVLETSDQTPFNLEWPEYAGERLFSIVDNRASSQEWRISIKSSGAWLLFIRPTSLQLFEDIFVRPTDASRDPSPMRTNCLPCSGWDDRARYVELLQILLFIKGISTNRQASLPRLAIVLSCWDELETNEKPEVVFEARLPFLYSFVTSTWRPESWSVWGLSSLGRSLKQDVKDDDFARLGPEHFGYVVAPDTTDPNPDLTLPVAWLLQV